MTQRAEQQLIVLQALDRGELLMAEAADLLGLSPRQVRRLRRRGFPSSLDLFHSRPTSIVHLVPSWHRAAQEFCFVGTTFALTCREVFFDVGSYDDRLELPIQGHSQSDQISFERHK